MQRRVFLAGLAGAAATVSGCSALGGGGGGGGGGGTGTLRFRNDTVTPTQVSVAVTSGGSTRFEDDFSLGISGDSASETVENVFEGEAPDTATLSVTVGTDDAVTYEWTVSEMETVQVTVVSDGVEFGAPE